MDKKKITPYASEEELIGNAENVAKAWQREEYEDYVFSARHIEDDPNNKENCLHLYLDEDLHIRSTNWSSWARHMSMDEKLNPGEVKAYEKRLCAEFLLWSNMENDRIKQLKREYKQLEKQAEVTAVFMTMAMNRKDKYKN